MNNGVGSARIGQWYLRWDRGEIFQVTGYDQEARSIEIQTFDGDLDEIEGETWRVLPLGLAEPPEDWTGPMDDVERDDLGYSETDMTAADWEEPLEPYRPAAEAWEATAAEDEGDFESQADLEELAQVGDPNAA